MKILLIEDTKSDIDAFDSALDLCKNKLNAEITKKNIPSFAEFETIANNMSEYDAVIIDIKLQDATGKPDTDIDAGNKIIKIIEESLQNVPIYIYTGTPGSISYNGDFVIKQCIKGGNTTYKDVIEHAYKLYCTGLMKIIGGRGRVQELIQKIYIENIKPDIENWISHKANGKNTEEILSRYIAACMSAHLESSCDAVTEEMFMIPPVSTDWKTGSIVKQSDNECYFVILTPECDLVLRNKNGELKPKTDYVLLCKLQDNFDDFVNQKNNLNSLFSHDSTFPYIYYIPKNTAILYSTFLNFREVTSIPYSEKNKYEKVAQILPEFTKEIIQKFSTYYSRQGQPDFTKEDLKTAHCVKPK